MTELRPTGITADRAARELIINWGDGSESRYPYDGLRAECPCVMCKGGHSNMGTPPNPCAVRDAPQSDLQLEDIAALGSYAVQIRWSDGHDSGIYTWKMLRQADPALCPQAEKLE